jgi:hypothetical protein
MIDDSDDKIRRNLVVAGAAVILSAVLQIPVDAVLRKLLVSEQLSIDEWRLWAVGLAILAYLCVRYRFTEEGHRFAEALSLEAEEFQRNMIQSIAIRHAAAFPRTPRIRARFEPELASGAQDAARSVGLLDQNDQPYPPSITLRSPEFMSAWALGLQPSYSWKEPRTANVSGGRAVVAHVEGPIRIPIAMLAKLRAYAYSKGGIVKFAPLAIGLVGIVILCSRIVRAYIVA